MKNGDNKSKYSYRIIEDSEEPGQVRIEKSGITAEFSMQDLETERKQLRKYLDEFKAKRAYEAARVENIEHFHPFVKELTEEQRFTVHMYTEAHRMMEACDKKIPEIEAELAENEATADEIHSQLGLRTKEEIVDEAVKKIVGPEHGGD